jgi:hypothetical protein
MRDRGLDLLQGDFQLIGKLFSLERPAKREEKRFYLF